EASQFTDGVWYLDFRTCRTLDGALRAALAVLGTEEDAGSPEQTLVAVLRSQSALLLVDACDHLQAGLERFIDVVLSQTRNVRVLAARREPCGVAGEAVVRAGALTIEDAIALYADRAGERARGEEAEALCERVGRVPLAIELLAAGAPAHACASVEAMVRRSVASLPPDVRSRLEALTVFPADFCAQAAAAVAECDSATLAQLERRSLIVANRDGDAIRYRIPDAIDNAVRQEIESSREERLRARHFEFYRSLAAAAPPAALHAERANLTAALDYAHSLGTAEPLLELAVAVAPYWFRRGHLSEGLRWLTAALDRGGDSQTPLVAQSLRYAGMLARRRSDQAAARYFNEKALQMWERLGNDAGVASALNGLALIAHTSGELETARSLYDRSRSLNEKMGDALGVAMATNNMGGLAMFAGQYSRAEALLREALALGERLDDRAFCALVSNNLAEVLFLQGRFADAQVLVEHGIAMREGLGDRPGLAASRLLQGHIYVSQERYAQAWQALRESLLSFRDVGNRSGVASSLLAAARLLRASGRTHEALRMVGNADAIFRRLGAVPLGLDKVVRDEFSSAPAGDGAASFEDAFEEAVAAFR
ncbi:MAG TPA: tetratricopeptide repeat protein, partial [Candidatus Baltobacteraceae bacterium]|nr:tetratricopeptide repeat protein [Candidatus Baltobacteraceae bacterium]